MKQVNLLFAAIPLLLPVQVYGGGAAVIGGVPFSLPQGRTTEERPDCANFPIRDERIGPRFS